MQPPWIKEHHTWTDTPSGLEIVYYCNRGDRLFRRPSITDESRCQDCGTILSMFTEDGEKESLQ